MIALGRERRLNCRLYMDRQGDKELIEKLDKLIAEKHFLNQTELIKHGLELVYKEVYEKCHEKISNSLGVDVKKMAKEIATELTGELRMMMEDIADRNGVNSNASTSDDLGMKAEMNVPECVPVYEKDSNEKVLSGQAFSFLKGLNED